MDPKVQGNKKVPDSAFSSHIRWCEIEGSVIVLDISRGAYFALGKETSQAWLAYAQEGIDLPADVFREIKAHGWLNQSDLQPKLQHQTLQPVSSKGHRLLALRCLWSARWTLSRSGFAHAYQKALACPTSPGEPTRDINSDLAHFISAEGWLPSVMGDRDCLPRSLALFIYLHRLGYPVSHVIGVARFPFDAHAWVEQEGIALLEYEVTQTLLPNARNPIGRTPIAIIA